MSEQHTNDSEWLPCPAGEFGRLNKRTKASERQRAALPLLSAASAVLLAAVALYGVMGDSGTSRNSGGKYGGITCPDVRKHSEAFVAGTLSERLQQRIEQHLNNCPRCAKYVRRLQESRADDAALPTDPQVRISQNRVDRPGIRDDAPPLPADQNSPYAVEVAFSQ